jgi:hypothetical protein
LITRVHSMREPSTWCKNVVPKEPSSSLMMRRPEADFPEVSGDAAADADGAGGSDPLTPATTYATDHAVGSKDASDLRSAVSGSSRPSKLR